MKVVIPGASVGYEGFKINKNFLIIALATGYSVIIVAVNSLSAAGFYKPQEEVLSACQ